MLYPVIELTQQLIRRPSPSPDDTGCQVLIIERPCVVGFTVERMGFGDTQNFWAQCDKGKTLAFAGHTDVVPVGDADRWISPPFEPTVRDSMLFGRGAADTKGSLAAMVMTAECLVAQHPNHQSRLAFLITPDEEANVKNGTVKVAEALMARNEQLDYCLVGEPSSMEIVGDVVKDGRHDSLICNLTTHGAQDYVTYPYLADNPVYRAALMLNELVAIEWNQGDEFFPATNMQIANTRAEIGSNNIIPGKLFIQLNFRFSTEPTDEMTKARVHALLEKHQLRYTVDWWFSGQPSLTECGKLVGVVMDVIEYYNGTKPQLLATGGMSDGRFIAHMEAQVVELGPVNATIHKINECVNAAGL